VPKQPWVSLWLSSMCGRSSAVRMREVIDQPVGLLDELFLRIGVGIAATAFVLSLARW
jgi:hypothetical protein